MTLLYTKSQTELIRQKVIDSYVIPTVEKVFKKHSQINSVIFAVAQYWDDSASDQVHGLFVYSVFKTPDWEAFAKADSEGKEDEVNLPDFKNPYQLSPWNIWRNSEKEPDFYDWNGLGNDEIAAFAAFCQEGCHQNMSYSEAYTPYAILARMDNDVKVEIVGKMLRPWLDGVRVERNW